MPDICIGFEVHQPFRLNRHFSPDPKVKRKDIDELYFDEINQEVLNRVCEKCYEPATRMILDHLDNDFRCAFSLSGTLVEQLEKWRPDILSLFDHVARHKNAEILGQTYYHSIASCFGDKSEFVDQVKMHSDLMHDLFQVRPTFFENTEFTFNNTIADYARKMGFAGIFTEGVDRLLGWRSPQYVYDCQSIPVLLRNIALSDDIAFRFNKRDWDKFPLMADTYAGWLAETSGDCINIFLDYETFGEHFWKETGIFEFLHSLPTELAKKGIETILPTPAVEKYPVVDTLDVRDTISWADIEKDTSAWMGNERQITALSAIQKAKTFALDKHIWRYLQTSDHFYYMASKYGTCGEVHTYFSHHDADSAFVTYMRVLADFEERNIRMMKNKKSARSLRTLPPEEAFHFAGPGGYIGYTAYNLDQLCDLLQYIPSDSLAYHAERGDFAKWVKEMLKDQKLALKLQGHTQRDELTAIVSERKEELWSHLT